MGKSSGGGDTTSQTFVRYAPYVEAQHTNFLTTVALYRNLLIGSSPFSGFSDIEVSDAFFGSGYTISSFPSLLDIFGKFMPGVDIDALYSQMFEDTVNSSEVSDLIAAESAILDEDIETNSIPRLRAGLRDMGAIVSSSYYIAKGNVESTKTRAISKFSSELKYNLIPVATDRWGKHLTWNTEVVMKHAEIVKLYFSSALDTQEHNMALAAKDKLWPFTVLDYERAALGALQGAKSSTTVGGETASTGQKALAGALSGAVAGAQLSAAIGMTGPVGAIIGGVLGLGSAFF